MGTCASKLGAVSAASTARQAASRGAGEGDRVRLHPQVTRGSHSKSHRSTKSDFSLSAANRSVLGKFLHPPGHRSATHSSIPAHQQYPHHYDTSPVSSPNDQQTEELPASPETNERDSVPARSKRSFLRSGNSVPSGQARNTTTGVGSSGNFRIGARASASTERLTENYKRKQETAERRTDNPKVERVAGTMEDPDDGKRSSSPFEGQALASEGESNDDIPDGEQLEGSVKDNDEAAGNARSEEGRPSVAETWLGSPQRRRRLSLSRSAEAREDDVEKARGQAIIAVGTEMPANVFLAQCLGTTRALVEKAETSPLGVKERSSPSAGVSEKRDSERQDECNEMRNETEADEKQSRVEAEDCNSGVKEHGVVTVNRYRLGTAEAARERENKTGDVHEESSPERYNQEQMQSPSLQNPQRRRLSVSRSATISPESPKEDEGARGHTATSVDGIARQRGCEGRQKEGRENKEGGQQANSGTTGENGLPSTQTQRGKPTARRLSVAGLYSERTQNNFEDKKVEKHGQAAQLDSLNQFGIGMCCKKGFKPESPNQDDFFIIKVDKWSMYGVFDGHGPFGHDVSNYVQRELPARLLYGEPPFLTSPLRALQTSFTMVHHELEDQTDDAMSGAAGIDCSMSGTTATVILHIHEQKKLFVAHVGDSRAVIGRREPANSTVGAGCADRFRPQSRNQIHRSQQQSSPDPRQTAEDRGPRGNGGESERCSLTRLIAFDLTNDHKPTNEIEKQRILKAGGQVRRLDGDVPHRVFLKNRLFPGLAMSRAIGDTIATQAGVIPDPEVREYELVEGRDEFLLVCSDGVWEFISSQEAVNMVAAFGRNQVQKACDAIARESWKRWIEEEHNVVDDITVLVIYFS